MTVSLDETAIALTGICGVEEVETLVGYLENHPERLVDLNGATAIHTALWQALMIFRPQITGSPVSSLIADKMVPGLKAYLDRTGELAKASSSK